MPQKYHDKTAFITVLTLIDIVQYSLSLISLYLPISFTNILKVEKSKTDLNLKTVLLTFVWQNEFQIMLDEEEIPSAFKELNRVQTQFYQRYPQRKDVAAW